MQAEAPEHSVGSGEVALWRAVIDQALHDAVAIKRILRDGHPTFASLESEKARHWFWRADANFAFVCDCADLNRSAVAAHALDVIHGGVGGGMRVGQSVEGWPISSGVPATTSNDFRRVEGWSLGSTMK